MAMTRLVNWFLGTVMGNPLASFERANQRPFATQEERLRRILRHNAETEIGREFAFGRMAALDGTALWKTFRAEVPVRGYGGFLPAIERMKAGAENVLIPGRPEMFALTAGTTAAPKFCPVNRSFIRERQSQNLLWMQHIQKNHPSAKEGTFLVLASPAEMGRTEGGIPYGALSGRLLAEQPLSVRRRMAAPMAAKPLEGAEHWFAILLFAMAEENIRVVAAENPVSLIALAQRLDRDSDRLLDAMELGRPGFPPNPSRARQLRDIRHASGTLTPRAVWPNLENILTWQGGAAGFHLPHVSALWGDTTMRCPGLRAAEGMFSIPLRDNDASGVLAVGGHVMEFLPCADAAPETIAPHAPTLLAGQLEEGRLYRLIATTSGGFYRYDTGDLLRVTGFRGRTPEVRFERRAGAGLSAAGEELTEDQVVSAMGVAAANGPLLNGFTLTYETLPEVGTRSVLALECTGGSELSGGRGKRLRGRLEQLLSVLDFELMQRNIGYNAKRQDGTLAFPRAVLLAEGSYARLRAGLADSGRPECQIKQPVLAQPPFFDAMPIAAEL